jgi:NAD(P)-dependent dehydrogenase (short-subunit alcohol dehydrogenase family)
VSGKGGIVMDLSGKSAIITGGGKGIGRTIALTYAKAGANISIPDVDIDTAKRTAVEVKELGQKGIAIKADVSIEEEVDALVKETLETFGRIDILVNNAGITQLPVSILKLDINVWDRVTDVDYKGVYLCCRRVGSEMVMQRSGCIINISSITGVASFPLVAYGPAKCAVIMLTKILAVEWAKYNIRVNTIAPGFTMTPDLRGRIDRGERDPKLIIQRTPMGVFIQPEDIAYAALFMASSEARYITGVTLPVDGGFLADGGWCALGGYER